MVHNSGRTDRKTSSQSRKNSHPYEGLERTPMWNRVDQAVKALLKNGDLELKTHRKYVVGYICHKIGNLNRKSGDRRNVSHEVRARIAG